MRKISHQWSESYETVHVFSVCQFLGLMKVCISSSRRGLVISNSVDKQMGSNLTENSIIKESKPDFNVRIDQRTQNLDDSEIRTGVRTAEFKFSRIWSCNLSQHKTRTLKRNHSKTWTAQPTPLQLLLAEQESTSPSEFRCNLHSQSREKPQELQGNSTKLRQTPSSSSVSSLFSP